MVLILESSALAVTLFIIGVLANYAGIMKKAERGFEFIIAGAFLYLFVAAAQHTLSQFTIVSTTFVAIGGLVIMATSLIALFCVMLGALYAVEDLSKRKK